MLSTSLLGLKRSNFPFYNFRAFVLSCRVIDRLRDLMMIIYHMQLLPSSEACHKVNMTNVIKKDDSFLSGEKLSSI